MSIVKEIDKLSGTDTRSRNITQAIDKLTGKGPSKNIGDAVRKMQEDAPTEKLLMTGGAVVDAGGYHIDINNFEILADTDYEGPAEIRFIGYKYSSDGSSEYVDYDNAVSDTIDINIRGVGSDPIYSFTEVHLPHAHDTYMSAELGESGTSTYIINENADDRPESIMWDSLEVWSKTN